MEYGGNNLLWSGNSEDWIWGFMYYVTPVGVVSCQQLAYIIVGED